ncbi:MAG: rRNA maturation RNase YbeY [Candidatus Omnitrophica bacterium]|nr:rRNA maturation RNase YbeY [Candidatus Omnitrophota bacterium]
MVMTKTPNIIIKNLQKKISISPIRIKKAILNAILKEGVKKSGEITVCFVTDAQIKKLNVKFLKHNRPTDVISFDISNDPNKFIADIAVSTDTAIRNSKAYHTTPRQELLLYAIHGILHLIGYNDSTAPQRAIMRRKESLYGHP